MSPDPTEEIQGRLRDAEAQIKALRSGQVDAVVGARGVSFLREREYEEKYRRLFETMGEGFVVGRMIYDSRGRAIDCRFIEVNPAYERLTGLRRDAALQLTIRELMPAWAPAWIEQHANVVATGEPTHWERYNADNGKHYRIITFRPEPGRFASIITDITARKQAEMALAELNRALEARVEQRTAELRILASRVTTAQEEERHRIAKGLHDSVCQLLAACHLKLAQAEACDDESARKGLLRAADGILRDANDEARDLTFELSSSALFDSDLLDSSRELCAYMTKRYDTTFEFTCPERDLDLPECMRPTLYHCLRELMHNVVKHAGVNHATVRVEKMERPVAAIRISVRDHGNGFDPEDLNRPLTWKGGLGLRHLRERMRDIGGTLSIESIPGDGTKAVLEVPAGRSRPWEGDP